MHLYLTRSVSSVSAEVITFFQTYKAMVAFVIEWHLRCNIKYCVFPSCISVLLSSAVSFFRADTVLSCFWIFLSAQHPPRSKADTNEITSDFLAYNRHKSKDWKLQSVGQIQPIASLCAAHELNGSKKNMIFVTNDYIKVKFLCP